MDHFQVKMTFPVACASEPHLHAYNCNSPLPQPSKDIRHVELQLVAGRCNGPPLMTADSIFVVDHALFRLGRGRLADAAVVAAERLQDE